MKIAFLHYDCMTKRTDKNLKQIIDGIDISAQNGAKWILTPELALQGYHFSLFGRTNEIPQNIEDIIYPILDTAKKYSVYVFLGCAVNDKKNIHGSTESWASNGIQNRIFNLDGIKTGILICIDIFYKENAIIMKELGADAIIVPAAWSPLYGTDPQKLWSEFSSLIPNTPIFICNQTGCDYKIDLNSASSAVMYNGKCITSYKGFPAILFSDINFSEFKIKNNNFEILYDDKQPRIKK